MARKPKSPSPTDSDDFTLTMELEDHEALTQPSGAFAPGHLVISQAGSRIVGNKLMIFVAASMFIDGLRKIVRGPRPCAHRFDAPNRSFSFMIRRRRDGRIEFSRKDGARILAEEALVVNKTITAAAVLLQQAAGTGCQDDAPVRDLAASMADLKQDVIEWH
jgi:hypothetical protein